MLLLPTLVLLHGERQGLRSVLVSRYAVFYHVMKSAIEIVRVLDERRDVQPIFPSEYGE